MKKSEKIEIRVSLDEKESLMRLAESEGRSVSELVRGLAKKYAQLNMPMPRPRFSRWHMAGLILCGVGIGSGAALSLSDNFNRIGTTQYMVHGAIDDHGFGFGVKDQIDTAESVTLGKGIGSYIIDVRVKNEDGEGRMAVIEVC